MGLFSGLFGGGGGDSSHNTSRTSDGGTRNVAVGYANDDKGTGKHETAWSRSDGAGNHSEGWHGKDYDKSHGTGGKK